MAFLDALAAVRRHHFGVVGEVLACHFRRMDFQVGLADHLGGLREALCCGERAIDGEIAAVRILHPGQVRNVIQDGSHARIGVSDVDRVPAQSFTHGVDRIDEPIEFVAFPRLSLQPQQGGARIRRDGRHRFGNVHQMTGRQSVDDEEYETGDQKRLRGIAQEDDQGLREQPAVDVRQGRLDMQDADDLRRGSAASQRKLPDHRARGLMLTAKDRQGVVR